MAVFLHLRGPLANAGPPIVHPGPDRLIGMNLYREQAVVLRTWKLGEADRIVVLMTQGQGKVRAVAKGIRKTKSRFGGRLEPFSHVDLSLYRGRELDIVTQAEVVAPFRALREDYDRVVAGTAMLEAVDQVAQERESAVRIYLLLVRALRTLDGGLCDRCRTGEESTLDRATVPLLAALLGDDLDATAASVPAPASRREAGALVKGYGEYHLERRLRAYPLVAR